MATKSKHRKNHKQKLESRKNRLAHEKTKTDKAQREFIMNLIKQEQEKGLFNDTPSLNTDESPINGLMIDGPVIDGLMNDGPVIDGLMIDGPVISVTVPSLVTENTSESKESKN